MCVVSELTRRSHARSLLQYRVRPLATSWSRKTHVACGALPQLSVFHVDAHPPPDGIDGCHGSTAIRCTDCAAKGRHLSPWKRVAHVRRHGDELYRQDRSLWLR